MSTPAAILLGSLIALGFGALGAYLRRIEAKLDALGQRVTDHEIQCAERWARTGPVVQPPDYPRRIEP